MLGMIYTEVFELQEENEDNLLMLSCMSEIIHTASMIIDDIQDKSELRRGDACVHLKYGIDKVLNSSNFYSFMCADILITQLQKELTETQKSQIIQAMNIIPIDMYLGNIFDVGWHTNTNYDSLPTYENFYFMLKMKTA